MYCVILYTYRISADSILEPLLWILYLPEAGYLMNWSYNACTYMMYMHARILMRNIFMCSLLFIVFLYFWLPNGFTLPASVTTFHLFCISFVSISKPDSDLNYSHENFLLTFHLLQCAIFTSGTFYKIFSDVNNGFIIHEYIFWPVFIFLHAFDIYLCLFRKNVCLKLILEKYL